MKYVGGVVVVAAVGAAGYGIYQATLPSPTTPTLTPTPTPTPTPTGTPTPTPTPTMTGPPPSEDPMLFDMWAAQPELVGGYLKTFNEQYNENAKLEVVSNYYPVIETKYFAGNPADMHYTHPHTAQRYYSAGWLRNVDDLVKSEINPYDIKDIKAELADSNYKWLEAYTTKDGKLTSLPYCQDTRGAMLTNEKLLEKVGLSGVYPETYEELYDNVRKLKNAGFKESYMPHWYLHPFHGICWGWLQEVYARGKEYEEMFDKNADPTFDTNTVAADVLKDWKKLREEDLAPSWIYSVGDEGSLIGGMASGHYAYSSQLSQMVWHMNDPARNANFPGYCSIVPPKKHGWGCLDGCGYGMTNKKRTPYKLERLKRWMTFMGYKDKNGEYLTEIGWLTKSRYFVCSCYKKVNLSEAVREVWRPFLFREEDHDTIALDLLETAYAPPVWKEFWYMDWQLKVIETLPVFLEGKITLEETIKTLRDSVTEYKKLYGG